jgi:hypothetical protein
VVDVFECWKGVISCPSSISCGCECTCNVLTHPPPGGVGVKGNLCDERIVTGQDKGG